MRIAHVSDCYLPRTGGIETQVRALALQQAAQGDEVVVLTATSDGARAGTRVVDGLRVERISMRLPGDLPIHLRGGWHVRRALSELRPDVVHIHLGVISPFAWSAIRVSTRMGLPTVITVHCVWGRLARFVYRSIDGLVRWSRWPMVLTAVSRMSAERVTRGMMSPRPVAVVPNGIDPLQWPAVGHRSRDGVLTVVAVMRLAPRKRLGALLRIVGDAASRITPRKGDPGEHQPAIRAIVVGDGPKRTRAERLVATRGWPITFTGRLSREQILDVFAKCDLFVQPSVKEAFGLAALEARTCGLPVLVRSESGSMEFVREGIEGFVAASDAEMVEILTQLALDPGPLDEISAHNAAVRPDTTWQSILSRLTDLYGHAAVTARRVRS